MKKLDINTIIRETIQEILKESTEIKVGDKVYWKMPRHYMTPLTISGVITKIDDDILTIRKTTQNSGGYVTRKKNTVTKSIKQ